jgi:hypothetical protein
MSDDVKDQPPPKSNGHPAVWPMVIEYVTLMREASRLDSDNPNRPTNVDEIYTSVLADMQERHELGVKRYGVALTGFNGRNQLIDLYQELLDATVYMRAWLYERGIEPLAESADQYPDELSVYQRLLTAVVTARTWISRAAN